MSRSASATAVATSAATASSDESSLKLYRQLERDAKEDTPFGRTLAEGLTVMRDAFRLYGPEKIVASFNGGKDAVVILQLSLAALAAHNEVTGGSARLRVIFFATDDEFPEIDAFVADEVARASLRLVSCANCSFADGLRQCIAEHGSEAFVLGTRAADPNAGGQTSFVPSSDWMPPFMRVNPILHWGYHDVWTFLRTYELPYCHLYDEGYTSLGKVASTHRNPALKRPDGSYDPAWQLADPTLERAGRVSSKPPPAAAAAPLAEEAEEAEEAGEAARLVARSAALLIVGDEILGGKQQDVNTLAAAQRLRQAGITLRRVSVVADDLPEIADELQRLVAGYDVVLTSGGLGPTHDDVTLKAVARALGRTLDRSSAMAETICARYAAMGKECAPEVLEKMSLLPSGVRIRQVPNEPEAWPILQCANVFVLPGVPTFFDVKLGVICSAFVQGASPPLLSRRVALVVPEERIVQPLNELVAAHPDVSFGSYPVSQGNTQTVITLEAPGEAAPQIEAALAALLALLPAEYVATVSDSSSLADPSLAEPAAAATADP